MNLLQGKTALVTGASRGIGNAIVKTYLENGANVYAASRNVPENEEELQTLAKDKNVIYKSIKMDVSSKQSIEEAIKPLLLEGVFFDIVVNNAGITKDALFFGLKDEDWDNILNVNLTGPFHILKLIIPTMTRKKTGCIINMSSVVGIVGNIGQANYAASKAGLIGLTKSLAQELGIKNIRVNAVAPGFIKSEMTSKLNEKFIEDYLKRIPLGRLGEVSDVAGVCLFLASDMANYVTGHVLNVSGGLVL